MHPKIQGSANPNAHSQPLLREQGQELREMQSMAQSSRQAFQNLQREQRSLAASGAAQRDNLLAKIHESSSLDELEALANRVFASHQEESRAATELSRNQLEETRIRCDFDSQRRELERNAETATSQVDQNRPEKAKLKQQLMDALDQLFQWREREIAKIQSLPSGDRVKALKGILDQALRSETGMRQKYIELMNQ